MVNIDTSKEWNILKEHAELIKTQHLKDLLQDKGRNEAMMAEHNGIYLDFSRQNTTVKTMDLLFDLAEAAQVKEKLAAMASGEHINVTEDRAVMHMALRAPSSHAFHVDGKNVVPEVQEVLRRIRDFSNRLREGHWVGATGKKLKNVISIGIGGSYLGPEFVFEALRHDSPSKEASQGRTLRFLANIDPVDVATACDGLNPEETLVIIVSKTFTTAETMMNARTLRKWLIDALLAQGVHNVAEIVDKHMIAVSAAVTRAVEFGINSNNIFGFWDWVGGRYSVCSAVGIVPLALHYGYEIMERFLAGAHDMDLHLLNAPIGRNLPVIMGLLGVWNSSFLGHSARAILPYSQALKRFPAHIQQVDMESNGKSVALDGTFLNFQTGEINFGEPGTNGQHSFYQLIHQGRIIPCDFIGICKSQYEVRLEHEEVSNHDELMSNFFAQPDALAMGKSMEDLKKDGVPEHLRPHKFFSGNRPSLSILLQQLDAFTIGQLLALYEHRTAVQGAIWGINSFDQWGVELGKVLAKQVRTQLAKCRKDNADIQGFNTSTSNLMKKYLAHMV